MLACTAWQANRSWLQHLDRAFCGPAWVRVSDHTAIMHAGNYFYINSEKFHFNFEKKNDFYNLTLLIQFLKYEWICSSKKTSNLTLWIFRVFTYWEINFPCVENLLPECCQDQVHIDRRTRICIHSAKYKKNSGHLFLATLMQCLDHTNLPLIRRGTSTFFKKKIP